MINFKEINADGEVWELFARDFLTELGFYVESSPDRGPDGKKDLIVSERLKGNLGKYPFKWLVSCKHFANSTKSVTEKEEPNISERVKSFDCDGFIGFYSTIPSAGLNTRLNDLKKTGYIKDYRVFDYKLIENYLISIGYSWLLMRYFPNFYKEIKPIHLLFDEYIDLKCKNCNKDLLKQIYKKPYGGLIAFIYEHGPIDDTVVKDIYWCCKGECDTALGSSVPWFDIGDLIIPANFIRWIFSTMNEIENGQTKYTIEAYEKLKYFIQAISQKVMREMTEKEKDRLKILFEL